MSETQRKRFGREIEEHKRTAAEGVGPRGTLPMDELMDIGRQVISEDRSSDDEGED